MEYRSLGRTGVLVSPLCLGSMNFGGPTPEDESLTILNRALDSGINFVDTANSYNAGESERILGRGFKQNGKRDRIVLATKVFSKVGEGPNDGGASRWHILKSCEDSLRRLQTDYIDLYQLHRPSATIPQDETLRAFDDLVRAGKVRYIGCSTHPAWKVMEALAISEKHHLVRYISEQPPYNLLDRRIENELVPLCLDQHLGILCWSPLSGGFFTGKFRKNAALPSDARRSNPQASSMKYWPVNEEKGYEIVEQLERIGNNYNKTIAQTALNWLLSKAAISSIIIGARNTQQLNDNAGASGWQLSTDDIQFLDKISQPVIPYPLWHQMYSDER